ncbi:MAG TPA: signal peptidase, partial [Ktedonobacterales bacterium]|nr:signal peptidase [Ktedonobacterales bacterium]
MTTVVGVRFRPAGRIYYFDPVGKEMEKGNFVIVETARGIE